MKTIIFVCHGNICRSPAAEWIMKQKLVKYGLENKYNVYSRATSREEIGNDIYPPMKRALYNKNIPFFEHRATQINQTDYDNADYIFYMDDFNKQNLNRLIMDVRKVEHKITEYTPYLNDIDDPWYSGQFDEVVSQIEQCIEDIIKAINRTLS